MKNKVNFLVLIAIFVSIAVLFLWNDQPQSMEDGIDDAGKRAEEAFEDTKGAMREAVDGVNDAVNK